MDFTYMISFILQTIFWINKGVTGKQLPQDITAGSGRDQIWIQANIIPVVLLPIVYHTATPFLYYTRKAIRYWSHFLFILEHLNSSGSSLPTHTGTAT